GHGIGDAARLAFEVGALLDAELLMEDVTLDAARRLQNDAAPSHRACDAAAHDHFIGYDAAGDACRLADQDVGGVQVALDLAIDMDLTLRDKIADDRQILADVGGARWVARARRGRVLSRQRRVLTVMRWRLRRRR